MPRKRKSTPPPPLQTRTKNKTTHPGLPDLGPPRRPTEVVQAEKVTKAKAQAEADATQTSAIEAVAAVENRMQIDDKLAEKEGNHPGPPTRHLLPRAKRAKPAEISQNLDLVEIEHNGVSSGSESDKFVLGEDEDVEEEVVDNDESDSSESVELAQGQGKPKKRGRADVIAARHTKLAEKGKEAAQRSTPAVATKKTTQVKSLRAGVSTGLVDGWKSVVQGPGGHSTSSISSRSRSSLPPLSSEGNTTDDGIRLGTFADNHDAAERKGLDSSEEYWTPPVSFGLKKKTDGAYYAPNPRSSGEPSQDAIEVPMKDPKTSKNTETTRVTKSTGRSDPSDRDIEIVVMRAETTKVVAPANKGKAQGKLQAVVPIPDAGKGRRDPNTGKVAISSKSTTRVQYKQLPEGMQGLFRDDLVPDARRLAGILPAFASPSLEEIQQLMDKYFPAYKDQYTVKEGDIFYNLILARLREHRSGFGSAGLEGMQIMLDQMAVKLRHQGHDDNEHALGYQVSFISGNPKSKYKERPFCWKKWGDGAAKSGRFQSDLVLYVFHWHLQQTQTPHVYSVEEQPYGALVMSILAVERALLYYRSGTRKVPSGSEGWFSKDNFGDRWAFDPATGRNRRITPASELDKYVCKLSEEDWAAIVEGAEAVRVKYEGSTRKRRRQSNIPEPEDLIVIDDAPESDSSGMNSD
ncbi:hypothetical protein PHLCEN_2v8112 [Hermanssonia centrifuga]|uniref:Uncharacterized protein n=1 Tax=Hermanssonia centrifuga TaxID=98765 RepID=A0A2R6NUM0_9APHY|nr:hypothetical protein PHLCEN_2v8112 [Hermanssonia centrifuga]